jgi:hypothetical protein
MDFNLEALCAYAAGLTLVAIGLVAMFAGRRFEQRVCGAWLAVFAISQGICEWVHLTRVLDANMPGELLAMPILHGLTILALYGLARQEWPTLQRVPGPVSCAVLALVSFTAAALIPAGTFEVAFRLILVCAGGALSGNLVLQVMTGGQRSSLVAFFGFAMLIYVLSNCLGFDVTRVAALGMALAALWMACREKTPHELRGNRARQLVAPAGFVVLLIAGCFALGATNPTLAAIAAPADEVVMVETPEIEVDYEVEPTVIDELAVASKRIGVAMSPILAIVAIVFLLSRTSFAR